MQNFLSALTLKLGERAVLTSRDDTRRYLEESRNHYHSSALAVVLPQNTADVAFTVKLCNEFLIGIVPQGGNTGRVGGSSVDNDAAPHLNGQIVLNLQRLNSVLSVDPLNFTMNVQAGCILANVQQTAAEHSRLFPLRLGAEGSCQIGGNLASNAGGVNALRYGSARDLVLGLEVVTASGDIWNGMNRLRKNNAGYPLRELFLGTEGTLGIITAAVLKLFPTPIGTATAMVGIESLEKALAVLSTIRSHCGDNLTAGEVISRRGIQFACKHIERCRDPFEQPQNWYLLLEIDGQQDSSSLQNQLSSALEQCSKEGLLNDAILATGETQRTLLWALREGVVEAQRFEGASIKHDISLPLTSIPHFVNEALPLIANQLPGIRPCPFGHLGDGNLHFNLSPPEKMAGDEFFSHQQALNTLVHDLVAKYDGSFAAEHGVGRLKRDELAVRSSDVSLAMMNSVKKALDPQGLMNPGKVLAP